MTTPFIVTSPQRPEITLHFRLDSTNTSELKAEATLSIETGQVVEVFYPIFPLQLNAEGVFGVNPVRQDDKLVLHVDNLIETGAEKVVMPRFLLLFRSHPIRQNQCLEGITNGPKKESQIARKRPPKTGFLANSVTSN